MKEEIVEIAQKQIMSGGYDALNFAAISEELNTSRTNLHHHFKNKEGLAREAIQSFVKQNIKFLNKMTEKHAGDFPGYFAEIDSVFLGEIEKTGRMHNCACDQLLRGDGIPESLRELSKDFASQRIAIHTKLIKESQNLGTMSASFDAERIAHMSIIFVTGIKQTMRASADPKAYAKKMRGSFTEWLKPYTREK